MSKQEKEQAIHEQDVRMIGTRRAMEAPLRVAMVLNKLDMVQDEVNEMTQEGILTEQLAREIAQAVQQLASTLAFSISLATGGSDA